MIFAAYLKFCQKKLLVVKKNPRKPSLIHKSIPAQGTWTCISWWHSVGMKICMWMNKIYVRMSVIAEINCPKNFVNKFQLPLLYNIRLNLDTLISCIININLKLTWKFNYFNLLFVLMYLGYLLFLLIWSWYEKLWFKTSKV